MEVYGRSFSIEQQDDRTPRTEADMAAHHVICDGLAALTPRLPVLSEEEADIPYSERVRWSDYWPVDPLDGTREFIKRNREITIVIAGSRSHNDPSCDLFLAQFDDYEMISMGSSLKSCLVAEGKADVYLRLGPTSELDTAAAQCVVEEAGGGVP